MFTRLANFIVAYRWLVLIAVVVLSAGALQLIRQLRFDFTVEALFHGEQEEREFSERFNNTFAHEDNVLVVIIEATQDKDVLEPAAINWQNRVAMQARALPHVDRVVALSTIRVPRPRYFGRNRVMMVPVIREDKELDQEEAELIRAKVAETPLMDGMLVSADRRCAAMAAFLDHEVDQVSEVKVVVESVEHVLAKNPPPDGYQSHITGLPAIRLDISQNLKADQQRIVPACAGLFLCILLFMYRRLSGLVIPWLSIAVAVLWSLAALVLLDVPLNIVTNVLPVMLMIVGVSNCVHVVSYYSEQTLLTPGDRIGIARRTLKHMGSACLLTCTTTAIGFLSLLVADAKVLFGFGWQAAMGMGFIYISTMLVAGALMPLMRAPEFVHSRTRATAEELGREDSFLARLAAALGGFAVRHPYIAVGSTVWVMIGAFALGSFVVVDTKLIDTYDDDDPVIASMRLAENKLGGFMPLELSLLAEDPTPNEQGDTIFQQPATFFRVAQAADYLGDYPEVTLVRSYVNLYRQMDRTLPGRHRLEENEPAEEDPDLPETRSRLSEAHQHFSANADASRYHDYMSADGTHARISVHIRDIGIRRSRAMFEKIKEEMAQLFPPGSGVKVRLTGDSYYSATALHELIYELFYSLIGAAAVIFLVIAFLLRSVRMALASILPNVTPLIVTLGYIGLMSLLGYDRYMMNTSNVIVFAISLGIAVDDTIHFLARFRDEIDQGGTVDEAIHRTCLGTGRAIVMTSLLIISGLSVVHMSHFVPTRHFAELTSVTMCAALLGDLILLPACLKLVWKKEDKPATTHKLVTEPRRRALASA